MGVKIELDTEKLSSKIIDNTKKVQKVLDSQVLKDSNFYCPMYTGTLQKSAILNTKIGSGLLVWDTPYAKAQYYGLPHKSTEKNPNASQKWFEVAKIRNLKKWEKIVNGEYNKNDK